MVIGDSLLFLIYVKRFMKWLNKSMFFFVIILKMKMKKKKKDSLFDDYDLLYYLDWGYWKKIFRKGNVFKFSYIWFIGEDYIGIKLVV